MSKRNHYCSSSDDESESHFSEEYGTTESRRGGSRQKGREAPNETVDTKRKTEKHLVDIYTCPITHELPEDPVIAEDGNHYERSAIQMHFDTNRSKLGGIRSPKTNLSMGERLVSSLQARETISTLLESGDPDAIGTLPDWWTVKITRSDAARGDCEAMYALGRWYGMGLMGLPEDQDQAYAWYEQSAKEGHTDGLAKQGDLLFKGIGTTRNETEGAILLIMAAERGSHYASFILGMAYYEGTPASSIRTDLDRASYWLGKSVGNGDGWGYRFVKYLSVSNEKTARETLKEIKKERES